MHEASRPDNSAICMYLEAQNLELVESRVEDYVNIEVTSNITKYHLFGILPIRVIRSS